ncbi:MAG: BrnT family toxin [Steroidobacteraceae bacterium]
MFVWDEAKRLANRKKHGIDFADAEEIFRGLTFTAEDEREPYGERRFLTLGLLEDQVVSVAHTERGEEIRIISIRKATKHEARFYFSQIPY